MAREKPPARPPAGGSAATRRATCADIIADPRVRECYDRLAAMAAAIHPDVNVADGAVEFRVEYDGCLLCRLVPYRALIHMRVGDRPGWETRVRGPEAFHAAADRIVDTFLRLASQSSRHPGAVVGGIG